MTPLSRLLAAQPKTLAALGGLVVLLLWVAVFDWNWFRPALERHLSQRSQRTVRIDDLHLGLNVRLQPVVRLRGVHIQNAAWAGTRPFVVAGEAEFTFDWLSLFQRVKLVSHLRLVDADIHLARQADGLRNWRLTRPDDRGPPRLQVLRLEPVRSTLQVVHQGVGLTLQATSSPLAQADGEFTQHIGVSGSFRNTPFAGEALVGSVLSLQRTGDFFALRGEASALQTRLHVDGRMADLLKLGGLDAQVMLSGASLGRSDVAGGLRVDRQGERFRVQATLHSQHLHVAELLRPGAPASTPRRLLPQTALPLAALEHIDATLQWTVDSLQAPSVPVLTGLQLRATLDQGQLQLALQDTPWAGGQLGGQFVLDTRATPPQARIALHAKHLRLEKVLPAPTPIEGPLSGELKLSGHGPSVAAWLGSASGQLSLGLPSGKLSPGLDAKLALNVGKLVRSYFASDKPVPIRCGALQVDFANGSGRVHQLVLDTAQTRVDGLGQVQLRDESWSLLLTPQAHQSSALALNSSLQVTGSFRDAQVTLVDRQRIGPSQAAGCD